MNVTTASMPGYATTHRTIWTIFIYHVVILLPIVGYALLGHLRSSNHDLNFNVFSGEVFNWSLVIIVIQIAVLSFPFVSSTLSIAGILLFGTPRDRTPGPGWRWDQSVKLVVAYVSRGNRPQTIKGASTKSQVVLDELGVSYVIEVVTDVEIPLEDRLSDSRGKVLYYVVPSDYNSARGARYKARALQYLLEQRTIRLEGREDADNVWVLHMDEESVLTPESVLGIQEHIEKYDLRRTPGAIGQGEILYNGPGYGDNDFVTAIDAGRAGGDLGTFRMQYKGFHKPLVGMHGSYVLTPARIEREITWDVGGYGSITEDSYFALLAMQRGVRFDWIEGFIREQSPFTVMDLIRQRRRWFCGLSQVSRDPTLDFQTRISLRLYTFFWGLSAVLLPAPLIFLELRFILGGGLLPYSVFLTAAMVTGFYAVVYLVGALRNLTHCDLPLARKLWIFLFAVGAWFLYIPALAECAGAIYGMLFPVTTFYVVEKDIKRKELAQAVV